VADKEQWPAGEEELRQQDQGTQALAEEPGYLTQEGEAAGEDGSVVPIIGGLPAAEGSAWDIGAPADERGAGLARHEGADQPGHHG
jgi:hypothetical protein